MNKETIFSSNSLCLLYAKVSHTGDTPRIRHLSSMGTKYLPWVATWEAPMTEGVHVTHVTAQLWIIVVDNISVGIYQRHH